MSTRASGGAILGITEQWAGGDLSMTVDIPTPDLLDLRGTDFGVQS